MKCACLVRRKLPSASRNRKIKPTQKICSVNCKAFLKMFSTLDKLKMPSFFTIISNKFYIGKPLSHYCQTNTKHSNNKNPRINTSKRKIRRFNKKKQENKRKFMELKKRKRK